MAACSWAVSSFIASIVAARNGLRLILQPDDDDRGAVVVGDHALGVLVERRGGAGHPIEIVDPFGGRPRSPSVPPVSRTLVPAGGMTISWAVVPLTCGNVRASESSAVWDSVPGRLNLSSNLPPATPAIPAEHDEGAEPGDQHCDASPERGAAEPVQE